jgi:hypothetical protein
LWRPTVDSPLVIAPTEAIISLRHERGNALREVNTPAGTLNCSTCLIRFKRFRNRCAYHLKLAFSLSRRHRLHIFVPRLMPLAKEEGIEVKT